MGFDALSDRSKSAERARRRKSHGTEFPQEARMGSHQDRAGKTCRSKPFVHAETYMPQKSGRHQQQSGDHQQKSGRQALNDQGMRLPDNQAHK